MAMTPAESQRKWRAANLEKVRQKWRDWYYAHHEEQLERQRKRYTEHQDRIVEYRERYNSQPENIAKRKINDHAKNSTPEGREQNIAWRTARLSIPSNRIKHLVRLAKSRAAKRGMEFDARIFGLADIPPVNCPCCTVHLNYIDPKRHSAGPSIDRIDNARGYILGNVAVICARCNRIKSDATLEELKYLIAYVEREMPTGNSI